MEQMIYVTKTFLPPKEDYEKFLSQIWDTNQIANGGNLHQELTRKLKEYLHVPNIILTTNGTLPLQISLKAMAKGGDVITTPFSYVATTSTIVWEGCNPIFVDIDAETLNIDAQKIESAITPNTSAILATHVFGNPCNIEVIEKIARDHKLTVIYDAAHCFGVKYKDESIFNYGDISTCSFHATKIFHTGEGGAVFCKEEVLSDQLFQMHNFGHEGKLMIKGLGINAKMSELQAGMGLAVLPYVKDNIAKNRRLCGWYDQKLSFKDFRKPVIRKGTEWNYSYYPVIFNDENKLIEVEKALNQAGIFPRRYFYPSLNNLPYVSNVKMPVSEEISAKILCLPLYSELEEEDVERVAIIVNQNT